MREKKSVKAMLLLPLAQYYKVEKPLNEVPFNSLFAGTVIEKVLPGHIFVDDIDDPSTFLIAHPYGMSLLFGETGNAEFNNSLHDYLINRRGKGMEWLQIFPLGWKPLLEGILGSNLIKKDETIEQPASVPNDPLKIMEYTRVNFKFDEARYRAFASRYESLANEIVRTTEKIFTDMQGQVIPRYFWRDPAHFLQDGIGFSVLVNGEAASTAFCAFMHDNMLELGIETSEQHRGKGYAIHACMALIDYCLENGYEPIWSCRLENLGSYKLAQKLGFEPVFYLPYYQLPLSK